MQQKKQGPPNIRPEELIQTKEGPFHIPQNKLNKLAEYTAVRCHRGQRKVQKTMDKNQTRPLGNY